MYVALFLAWTVYRSTFCGITFHFSGLLVHKQSKIFAQKVKKVEGSICLDGGRIFDLPDSPIFFLHYNSWFTIVCHMSTSGKASWPNEANERKSEKINMTNV